MNDRKRALVVEGGGLRGAYVVGVLRVLHDHGGPDQFDLIVAESSGVFAAAFFLAGQVEEMESTWRDLVDGRKLIDYWNLLRRQPILKLDSLIGLFQKEVRLDVEKLISTRPELWYVLTDYRTGEAVYLDAKRRDIFDLMRASSALPFVYPLPVAIDGRSYYDGGHSDAIPIAWAISRGCRDILAILTQETGYRKSRHSGLLARLCLSDTPQAGRALRDLHVTYNRSLDMLKEPPPGININALQPAMSAIGRFTTDRAAIIRAIDQGKADALKYLSRSARNATS